MQTEPLSSFAVCRSLKNGVELSLHLLWLKIVFSEMVKSTLSLWKSKLFIHCGTKHINEGAHTHTNYGSHCLSRSYCEAHLIPNKIPYHDNLRQAELSQRHYIQIAVFREAKKSLVCSKAPKQDSSRFWDETFASRCSFVCRFLIKFY